MLKSCCKLHKSGFVKAGIHCTTFAQILAPNWSLEELVNIAESNSLSEDFGQLEETDFTDGHKLHFYLHSFRLWSHSFEGVSFRAHIVFICHASSSNEACVLCDFVVLETTGSLVDCDHHSFGVWFPVSKSLMPSLLKCSYYAIWKLHNLVLGVPYNRVTWMQGQKLSFSYNTVCI